MILLRPGLALLVVLALPVVAGCAAAPAATPTPYPTYTPYPTFTPYPTPAETPVDEIIAQDIYDRIAADGRMPPVGKEALIWMYFEKPTYAFPENSGTVVQFDIQRYPIPLEAKTAAYQLVDAAVAAAEAYHFALVGVEVLYSHEGEPWVALASRPPWGDKDLVLVPIAPEMIQQLIEGGIITPTPQPVY